MANKNKRNDYYEPEIFVKRPKYVKDLPEIFHYVNSGDKNTVNLLVKNSLVDINAQNSQMVAPIHIAAIRGDYEMFKLLLELGAELFTLDILGRTVLHMICRNAKANSNNINYKLIGKISISMKPQILDFKDYSGRTALHVASQGSKDDLVQFLLDLGATVDTYDHLAKTPLYLAISKRNLSTVKILLKSGANPNIIQLGIAVETGCPKIVELLLDYGSKMYKDNYLKLNNTSDNRNDLNVLKFLLNNGVNPKLKNIKNDYYTGLHLAAKYGHYDIVKLFIKIGVNINEKNFNGFTPLYLSIKHGHYDTTKLLLDSGGYLNDEGIIGQSLLHVAVTTENLNIIQVNIF